VAVQTSQADIAAAEDVRTLDQAVGTPGLVWGEGGQEEGLITAIGLVLARVRYLVNNPSSYVRHKL